MAALAYGGALALALAVLWRWPAAAGPGLRSATSPLYPAHSGFGRFWSRLAVAPSQAVGWLGQVWPQLRVGAALDPGALGKSLLAAAVDDAAGRVVHSVGDLLAVAVPDLNRSPRAPARPVSPPPAELEAVEPGLPGDHGKVWAQLGAHPLVGIYQTHSRESFWSELPPGSATAYSTAWDRTIVQVGWWLAQDLHRQGIAVVQSRVDNMRNGLLASYAMSYATARRLLKWYPQVRILIDLHRGDAPGAQTTAVIDGRKVAKIRIVVGTDQVLADPLWRRNWEFAATLAKAVAAVNPALLRGDGVEVVPYRYNQQLLVGDLLIEVGGPDNTLAEERRAVFDLAEALGAVVRTGSYPRARESAPVPGPSPSLPGR